MTKGGGRRGVAIYWQNTRPDSTSRFPTANTTAAAIASTPTALAGLLRRWCRYQLDARLLLLALFLPALPTLAPTLALALALAGAGAGEIPIFLVQTAFAVVILSRPRGCVGVSYVHLCVRAHICP